MIHHVSSMNRATSLGLLFVVGLSTGTEAQDVAAVPRGIFFEIETRLAAETMHILAGGRPAEKARAIDALLASPETFAPPVRYLLSHVLFGSGDRDEAAFWFYAGQLRARVDANRCADISARQAVSVLNDEYGPRIDQYTSKDIPKLKALIPRVVEWDTHTPRNHDHRWITLHGMEAIRSAREAPRPDSIVSLPADQREPIADKTRNDYLAGFLEAFAQLKAMNK